MAGMDEASPATAGRGAELRVVEAFARAPGTTRALVLAGEAGIGKTTLWRAGLHAATAAGATVLRCEPAAAETGLSFSALADLVEQRLGELEPRLAPPQRHALRAALLLEAPEPAPEPRAIAVAFLSSLRLLAESAPVLLAIDDLQWLDQASSAALAFAVRRLGDARVALLAALRDEPGEAGLLPFGLEEALAGDVVERVEVGPLDLDVLHDVLLARIGRAYPRPLLARIRAVSGGNPFYALEVARSLERRGGTLDPDETLPVPDTLRGLVDEDIDALPEAVRRLLGIVAARFDPRLPAIEEAARRAGLREAIDLAVAAGMLRLERRRLRFAHPLLGAAVYARLSPLERRAVHRLLADVVVEGEERALHLALATTDPDGEIATELERAAVAARARGACASAARLSEHAARLTPAAAEAARRRRLFAAADHHAAAGDPQRASAIFADLAATLPPGPDRARAISWHAWVGVDGLDLPTLTRLHVDALREAADDPAVSALLHLRLGVAAGIAGEPPAAARHAGEAVELARAAGEPSLEASALRASGYAQMHLGRGVVDDLRRGVELAKDVSGALSDAGWAGDLAQALIYTDALDEAREAIEAASARAEGEGHELARAELHFHRAELELRAGDLAAAAAAAEESVALHRQVSNEQEVASSRRVLATVDAVRGRVDAARAAAVEGLAVAERWGDRTNAAQYRGVLGFVELSLGEPAAAHAWLEPAVSHLLGGGVRELAPFLAPANDVEALVALGRLDEAETVVAGLERVADATGRRSTTGVAARGRALVAAACGEPEAAREASVRARAAHEGLGQPFELARTLLAEGVIERRFRQKRRAREPLERALRILEELGAPLWAARARDELRRLGLRRAPHDLTETEERIARLAARGLTNREIAAAAFVSQKTVEANLRRAYRKLGVRSRAELVLRIGVAGS
jgi:DNA-binding CsgD family transcriptional regulator